MAEKMDIEDLANMMCASIDAELIIRKRVGNQDVEIEGGTGLVVMDMYLVAKALEVEAVKMLPMTKSAEDLRQALHGIIDLFDFGEQEKEENDAGI